MRNSSLLVAVGGIEARPGDPHRRGQLGERGALVAVAPEHLQRARQGPVDAELLMATQRDRAPVPAKSYRSISQFARARQAEARPGWVDRCGVRQIRRLERAASLARTSSRRAPKRLSDPAASLLAQEWWCSGATWRAAASLRLQQADDQVRHVAARHAPVPCGRRRRRPVPRLDDETPGGTRTTVSAPVSSRRSISLRLVSRSRMSIDQLRLASHAGRRSAFRATERATRRNPTKARAPSDPAIAVACAVSQAVRAARPNSDIASATSWTSARTADTAKKTGIHRPSFSRSTVSLQFPSSATAARHEELRKAARRRRGSVPFE